VDSGRAEQVRWRTWFD